MAGREYYYFPLLLHILQERYGVGPDIEPNLKGIPFDIDGKLDIGRTLILLITMNESLIEI
jgi:hypothetical protein